MSSVANKLSARKLKFIKKFYCPGAVVTNLLMTVDNVYAVSSQSRLREISCWKLILSLLAFYAAQIVALLQVISAEVNSFIISLIYDIICTKMHSKH